MSEKNVEHWTKVNADFADAQVRRAWAERDFVGAAGPAEEIWAARKLR